MFTTVETGLFVHGLIRHKTLPTRSGPPSMVFLSMVAEGATLSIVRPPLNTEPENKPPNNAKNGTPVNATCPRLDNDSIANPDSDWVFRKLCPLVQANPFRSTPSILMTQQSLQRTPGNLAMNQLLTPQKFSGKESATSAWISGGGRVGVGV